MTDKLVHPANVTEAIVAVTIARNGLDPPTRVFGAFAFPVVTEAPYPVHQSQAATCSPSLQKLNDSESIADSFLIELYETSRARIHGVHGSGMQQDRPRDEVVHDDRIGRQSGLDGDLLLLRWRLPPALQPPFP
jgi:hypothetical protein